MEEQWIEDQWIEDQWIEEQFSTNGRYTPPRYVPAEYIPGRYIPGGHILDWYASGQTMPGGEEPSVRKHSTTIKVYSLLIIIYSDTVQCLHPINPLLHFPPRHRLRCLFPSTLPPCPLRDPPNPICSGSSAINPPHAHRHLQLRRLRKRGRAPASPDCDAGGSRYRRREVARGLDSDKFGVESFVHCVRLCVQGYCLGSGFSVLILVMLDGNDSVREQEELS